jgi:hypothetical protein
MSMKNRQNEGCRAYDCGNVPKRRCASTMKSKAFILMISTVWHAGFSCGADKEGGEKAVHSLNARRGSEIPLEVYKRGRKVYRW